METEKIDEVQRNNDLVDDIFGEPSESPGLAEENQEPEASEDSQPEARPADEDKPESASSEPEEIIEPPLEDEPDPEVEKKSESQPEFSDPEELDPKASASWAILKSDNKKLKAKLQELESREVADPEQVKALQEQIAEKEEQIDKYEDRLGQYDLASTKKFREKYDFKISAKLGQAANMLARLGMEKAEARTFVQQLLKQGLEDRVQRLSEEAPALQGALINLFEDIDDLALHRTQELRNWRQVKAAQSEEEKASGVRKVIQTIKDNMAAVNEELQKSGDFLFNNKTQSEEWNAQVSQRLEAVGGILQSGDLKVITRYVAEGLALPTLRSLYTAERKKRKALESELTQLSGSTPPLRGGADREAPARQTQNESTEATLDKIW